jgi:hypothetical protein
MKGNKRGTPTPKTAPGARKTAPKRIEKPFRLRVGRFYADRSGKVFGPLTRGGGIAYPYLAHTSSVLDRWTVDGRYFTWDEKSPRDLIREVRQPKAPVAPKGRRAPK